MKSISAFCASSFLLCGVSASERGKIPGSDSDVDKMTLRNPVVYVTVRPDIGRIVSFADRLWEPMDPLDKNAASPVYGGHFIQVSPQNLRAQIRNPVRPDVTDGGAWEVMRQEPRQIRMRKEVDDLGLEIIWTIHLHNTRAKLLMEYKLTRITENPFPVHLWSITRVPLIGNLYLSYMEHAARTHVNLLRSKALDDHMRLLPNRSVFEFSGEGQSEPLKTGTFGRWIAHIHEGKAFIIISPSPERLPYADASNLQAFSWGEKQPFYEMEVTSPMYFLRPGESFTHWERWILTALPDTNPAGQLDAIEQAVQSSRKE